VALPALVLGALLLGALLGYLTRAVLSRLAARTRTACNTSIAAWGSPLRSSF